ncbi:hypothetical protein AVEN_220537-1, partial [Araneus ventricosus]
MRKRCIFYSGCRNNPPCFKELKANVALHLRRHNFQRKLATIRTCDRFQIHRYRLQ